MTVDEVKIGASEAAWGPIESFEADDAPAETLEAFWRSIAEIENAEWVTGRQQLQSDGIDLPPPTELTDPRVADKLSEVFNALAARGVYVSHTDHLSDRALYEQLWYEKLDEQHPAIVPAAAEGEWFIDMDMVGDGSDDDTEAFLRYYADRETRRQWRAEWPDTRIPRHEDPPYDRDRHLPVPPESPFDPQVD